MFLKLCIISSGHLFWGGYLWRVNQKINNLAKSWSNTCTYGQIEPENYLKFYAAIRQAYPDIKMISNCDGSRVKLDHPAEMYDFHVRFYGLSSFSFFYMGL